MDKVKIVLSGKDNGKIYVNDALIEGVQSIILDAMAGQIPLLRLGIRCRDIEIESAEAEVKTTKVY